MFSVPFTNKAALVIEVGVLARVDADVRCRSATSAVVPGVPQTANHVDELFGDS